MTDDDEGKLVHDAEGDEVGRVIEVERGDAHVEPDPDLTDAVLSKLGWGDSDEETYQLDQNSVESVTDDEIRPGRYSRI